jgi:CubicO group peptidase (beta-lactamase class C family)
MMKHTMLLAALLAGLFFVPSCGGSQSGDQSQNANGTRLLPRSTPEEQGMDSAEIANLVDRIRAEKASVNGFLVLRHGTIVAEGYFFPYVKDYRQQVYGITSTVLAGVTGIALEEKIIKSLDDPMLTYLEEDLEYENPSPQKKNITLRQLLTHTSGVAWEEQRADEKNSFYQMSQTDNYLQYFLDRPMKDAPGQKFNWSSGGLQALSAVIQTAADQPTFDLARLRLFEPLGIKDVYWAKDIEGINIGGIGLSLNLPDLAKVGLLYLQKGVWEGKQIIPAAWIAESMKTQVEAKTPAGGRIGAGYGWLNDGAGNFFMNGDGGQYLIVVPESDLVAVFTGSSTMEEMAKGLPLAWTNEYLKKAIANKNGAAGKPDANSAALEKKLAEIAAAPAPEKPSPLPALAKKIEGKKLRCADSTLYKFFFGADNECRVETFFQGLKNNSAVGLDHVYRINKLEGWPPRDPVDKYQAAFRGRWLNDTTFILNQLNLGDLTEIELAFVIGQNDFQLSTTVRSLETGKTLETKTTGEILWDE